MDGIGYVTLQAAVDAASDGDTIYLNKDTETTPVTIDKSVSLDLGKNTLKIIEPASGSSDRWGITFTSDDCAITNGTILDERSKTSATKVAVYVLGSNGHASLSTSDVTMSTYPCKEDSYSYVLRVEGDASATLNSGTIINESQNESGVGKVVGVAVFGNNVKADTYNTTADLIVSSGVTIETSGYAVSGNGSNQNGTNITINGGALKSTKSLGIYHPQDGVLTINDGSISGITGVEIRSGTLIMNGGSVEGTASDFVAVENGNGPTSEGAGIAVVQHTTEMSIDVSVKNGDVSGIKALYEANVQKNEEPVDIEISLTGGNFIAKPGEGSTAVDVADVKEFISGGTYNTDVSDYAAPGFAVIRNPDGTYGPVESVSSEDTVNENGQTVQASVSGDTITIPVADEGFTDITFDLSFGSTEITIVGDVESDVTVRYYTFGSTEAELAFELYIDGVVKEGMEVVVAVPVTLGENESIDTDTLYAYSVTDNVQTPETVYASGDYIVVVTDHNTPFYVNYDVVSSVPFPPVWDDDDDYVPPIVPSQTDDSGDDSTTEIVACAAAAVVAALMAAFLIIERRRN